MRKWWSRFQAAEDGLGAIEFGFVAPVLATIMIGILDFGLAYWEQLEIAGAADAGAQWGESNTFDTTNIRHVVQAASNLSIPDGNITPANLCGCASNTGITTYGSPSGGTCSTTCPDGSTAKSYIVVTAHTCYQPLFAWPGLSYCSTSNTACNNCTTGQITLTAQSVVLKQ